MTVGEYDIYIRLALAVGLGLMVGLERGWHTREIAEGRRIAGVRTFTLIGLFGGLLGRAGQLVGDAVVAIGLIGFVGVMSAAYYIQSSKTEDRGLTTEVAAFITLILGLIAMRGDMLVSAMAAVLVVAVLAMKKPLHHWLSEVRQPEIDAAIKLLLMSVVMLPLLPNEDHGPGGVFNPYELWWVVVVITGISFIAYAAIRVAGTTAGIFITGLLGGLASSTAVTLNSARLVARAPGLATPLSGGIAVASAVMFVRGFLLVYVLHREAAEFLAAPLLSAAVAALITGLALLRRSNKETTEIAGASVDLGPPADIVTALKFAAALIVIGLAVHYGRVWFGAEGSIAAAALAGLVDIDAATVSVARFGESGAVGTGEVVAAVLAAVAVNSAAKFVYALVIARRPIVRPLIVAFAVPVVVGVAGWVLMSVLKAG